MANIEECTRSRPVLKVLGPIATQVVELRGRQGVECDAQTILRLIKLCHALKESCALLPARLTQQARSLRDTELDRAAGQAGRRLERVVDALTDATRDLYQGGEADVCDNTEVWSSILDTTEQLLSALTDALLAWDRSQFRRLTTAANQMHSCLSRLLQVYSLQHLPQEFQVMVSSGAVLARLVEWRCRELCQRGQKEGVMVASLQLRWAMTLLAKVCVASSTTDTTGGLPMDSCHAKVSRELVVNRVKQLVDEVVTQAGPGPPHTPKHDPAAFTTCIDKILDVLLGQEKLKGTETEEQEKEDSAPRDEEKSQDENREDVVKDENQKEKSRIEEERNVEKERMIKKKEDEAEEVKRNRTDEIEEGEVIKEGEKREGVSVRVRPLLEVALQHSLAVACCATKHDHTAIMTAAENVLRHVKVLVNQERRQVPDKVDLQMACDTLAEATEVLEQHVNTALIRLIVQVFSIPEAPLDALVEALGLETNTTGRSGANCKEEGSETGSKEESIATSSKEASGTDCMEENRGTERERKQSEESRVENLVADFDLHVDRVFQAGGLAVACTTDPPKVQLIEGSLSTLEWLEGCLVPALLTAARAHSTSATTHAFLLLEHWKNAVATLTSCLHNIMDPAAFVMVSQDEVQRVWADLKAGLYSQDTEWVKRQADQVVALTSRVLQLHQTQCSGDSGGDGFLTDAQTQDLITAMNEVKVKVRALAAAPSDLARHRSLLKRVQLCLTLLSRLMTSLNHDYEEHLDQTYQTHADVSRNSAHPPKLTKTERYQLVTSDINDIPLDLATPVPTPAAPPLHHRQLRRSLRSSSKLSEWRPLTSGEHSVVASGGVGNGRGESVAMCDTSIDISRFLSRSTNLLSSTRGSRRNITLKVKEINLDLAGDLVVRPHQPPKQDEDYSMAEVKHNPSLVEVSELIAEHGSPAPPSHQTLSHHLSGQFLITGILETVTSMVGDLASPPPHLPSPGKKRKCPWESFSEKNKENDSTSPNTVLHGIKLHHASFNPHFPDITPGQDSGLFKGDEEEEMVKVESSDNGIVGGSCQTLGEAQDYQEVWKDFTAIIENHTPARTDGLNFSNNFVIQDPITPLLPPKPPVPNKPCEMKSAAADLSDTPFLKVSGPGSTQYIAASSSSLFRHASNSSLGSSTSVSSSSASITTPQRLLDLQVVQQRLHRLRRSLKS